MNISSKKELIQKSIVTLICLLFGLILYILFGTKILEIDLKLLTTNTIITKIFRNHFFDFIWAFSFYIICSYIMKIITKKYKFLTGLYVALIGIVYELLQLFNITSGTFDVFDILTYIIAVAVASIIEKKIWSDTMKKINKTLTLFLMILCGVFFMGCAMGSGSDANGEVTDAANGDNEKKQEIVLIEVGKAYKNSEVKLSYIDLDDNYTNYSSYSDLKEGNKIIRLTFDVENLKGSDFYISNWDFKCYADGYSVDDFIWAKDNDTLSATLSSGKKTKGSVYFEVPKNASEIVVEYEVDWLSDKKIGFKVK